MVRLFKSADPKSNWVRVPVINFARACPLPDAKLAIEEFEKLDPEAVRRAGTLFPFAGLQPKPGAPSTDVAAVSTTADPVEASPASGQISPPNGQNRVPASHYGRWILVTCLVVMMMGAASIVLLNSSRSREPTEGSIS